MRTIDTTPRQRTIVRRAAGLRPYDSRPVDVLADSDMPPRETGESYYHTTLSGRTVVHSPGAYGWPTRYWPSTRCVEVGDRWLEEHTDYLPALTLYGPRELELAAA